MSKKDILDLKEEIKKSAVPKTIISTTQKEEKGHIHFYLSEDIITKLREFQVKNRKKFPRISHVVEAALRNFLSNV